MKKIFRKYLFNFNNMETTLRNEKDSNSQTKPTQNKTCEIKKMKQGMSYTCKEKIIILNVFKYFKLENPDMCVTEIVRRTSKATGCSEKSIFQFRKEENSTEGFKEPSKKKIRKNININSRYIKYDDTVRNSIRNIIYDIKNKSLVPSLSMIMKRVNEEKNFPKFSVMTLRRLLFDMGFSYEKNGTKAILVEKNNTKVSKSDLKHENKNIRFEEEMKINERQFENVYGNRNTQNQTSQREEMTTNMIPGNYMSGNGICGPNHGSYLQNTMHISGLHLNMNSYQIPMENLPPPTHIEQPMQVLQKSTQTYGQTPNLG